MVNEVRLIGCRRCDERNCKGCNIYTLSEMLRRGEFDCMMDEHHSIVITPESLRPKGRWVSNYYKITCSLCKHSVFLGTKDPVIHNAEKENFKYCPNCGAKMEG